MIAIQYTNSFEINATGLEGRAIYPIISKINHSCIPNVAHCNTIFGENTTYHLNGSGEDVKGKSKRAQSVLQPCSNEKVREKSFSTYLFIVIKWLIINQAYKFDLFSTTCVSRLVEPLSFFLEFCHNAGNYKNIEFLKQKIEFIKDSIVFCMEMQWIYRKRYFASGIF